MNAGATDKQAVGGALDVGSRVVTRPPLGWSGFRPGLPMTLFVLIMLPVLISLGRWQLDRAEQKLDAFAAADTARLLPPLSIADYAMLPETSRRYRTLRVRGRLDPDRVLLLDNQIQAGQVGYWILQHFEVEARSERFLVNRGFIAGAQRRDLWPPIETPEPVVELSGVLWPQLGLLPLLEDDAAVETAPGSTDGWPRRVQRLDFATFGRWLPELEPMELRLTADSNALLSGAAPTVLPNGAPRHQGYAVQWFGLATVLMIGFVVFGRVNARESVKRITEKEASAARPAGRPEDQTKREEKQ